MAKDHGVSSQRRITTEAAVEVARSMQALATPSRVCLLARLREGPCSVSELTQAVDMEQPAVSHQLRILRDLQLVVGVRAGRQTIYQLLDPHISTLLDEALRHVEHLRAEPPAVADRPHEGAIMTNDRAHEAPHTPDHAHPGRAPHAHAHTEHDHSHVEHEHEHEHEHDDTTHAHPHVHQEGLEEVHDHQ